MKIYNKAVIFTGLLTSAFLMLPSVILAATYTVTSTTDSVTDKGSLRYAISQVNSTNVDNTITFAPSLAGKTILLTASYGPLTLKNLGKTTIDGSSASGLIISGGGATGVFLIFTPSNINTILNGLTISNGSAYQGGGIDAYGSLTVTNSTISGNSASDGGGIYAFGSLTVTNSTISGNSAGWGGGGIYASGPLTVTNSTISGNSANDGGGGIYDLAPLGVTVTVTNSTISGNSANYGGGIYALDPLTVTNSTISGNSANYGGGIYAQGSLKVTNSTISGNSTNFYAGGIFAFGSLTVTPPSGAANLLMTVTNSIIAGNTSPSGADIYSYNYIGTLKSRGYNLIGDSSKTSAQAISGFTPLATDIVATSNGTKPTALSAILNATLANNGGPTKTLSLVAGSPAIDHGSNALIPSGITTDQRGLARIFNNTVDIGAFEYNSLPAGVINLGTFNNTPVATEVNGSVNNTKPTTYKFIVNGTGGNVNLSLNANANNVSLKLLDSNFNQITSSTSNTQQQSIKQQLKAGTYYIQVVQAANATIPTSYNLSLSKDAEGTGL